MTEPMTPEDFAYVYKIEPTTDILMWREDVANTIYRLLYAIYEQGKCRRCEYRQDHPEEPYK